MNIQAATANRTSAEGETRLYMHQRSDLSTLFFLFVRGAFPGRASLGTILHKVISKLIHYSTRISRLLQLGKMGTTFLKHF